MESCRLVVLVSGSGSNLQVILDACNAGNLKARVVLVISNRKDAFALERAQKCGVDTRVHSLAGYKAKFSAQEARQIYDEDLARLIITARPKLVICAGWMHILSIAALQPLSKNQIGIINLHPALPGCFDGANAIKRAFKAYCEGKIQNTGIMIHWVTIKVDGGQPILTKNVEILHNDTLQTLEKRIHKVEHSCIVEGIKLAIQD